MDHPMNDIAELVQQGLAAARVGDREEARRLLTRATQQQPDNVDAWLGLAGVVDSLPYKEKCFTTVLALDPANSDARAGLALLAQKMQAKPEPPVDSPAEEFVPEGGIGPCYRHPETETGLRCNKCGKFICTKCAKRTPVGFRCPDCIREQEDKYYTNTHYDYIIAAVVALPLSLIAAAIFTLVLSNFGFFTLIIGFFVAPFAAGLIADAVRWSVGRRRGRYLRHVGSGWLVRGTLPFILLTLLTGACFALLMPGMLIFLGAATIAARLR
jgi:hypothetical protein